MVDNEGVLCEEQVHCVACGSPGETIHSGMRDQLFGAPGSWATQRCTNAACRLGWLDPMPLPAEVIKLYQTYYTHTTAAEEGVAEDRPIDLADWTSRGLKARVKAILRGLLPWWRLRFDTDLLYVGSRKPGRALEVGCGAGHFLGVLKAAGWDVFGLDFDEKAIAAARRAGVDAKVSDLFAERFPDGSFDAIMMDNVIEHLPDPPAVFAECLRVLRPGGRIVFITPNLDGYIHQIYAADWRGLEIPRHLYLYTGDVMRRLAKDAGFAHVEVFSQPRGPRDVGFMIDQSRLIAERSGRTPRHADAAAYAKKAARLSWFGRPRSEFLVLIAER